MTIAFECGPRLCSSGDGKPCDGEGEGVERIHACAFCDGTGITDDQIECERCRGDGLGGGSSSTTCSRCGSAAIDRALWEGP
jgi:hypothetical protein